MVDGILTSAALEELRSFCLESTVFRTNYIQGYQGAFLSDGFGSAAIVLQVPMESEAVCLYMLLLIDAGIAVLTCRSR
jgi:hypothetical protein